MDQNVLNWISEERNGALDATGRAALAAWRAADPEHEAAYRTIQALWEELPAADPARQLPAADPQAAWDRFQAALPPGRVKHPVRRSLSTGLLLRVAAAATLLLAAVWYLSRPETAAPLQYLAENGDRALSLPDGSEVVLRQHAVLTGVPQTVPGKARRFRLTGEAFFQVRPDKTMPFVVETGTLEVTVLGTAFYITAPKGGHEHAVSVTEGRVGVRTREGAQEARLSAGEAVACGAGQGNLHSRIEDPNGKAWHTGVLIFQGAPLSEVLSALEEHFDARVRLSDAEMAACRFTGRMERSDLQSALRALAASMDMTLKSAPEGVYYLTGGNCK